MVIDNNYKIKHFYRFIEFILKLLGKNLPHERFKLISTDNFKAESKLEVEVKKIADAYLYLLNNINQSLTTDIIKNSYFILTGMVLDDEIAEKIIKLYYQNYDEATHYLAVLIHFCVLDNIKTKKIEFAFMLSNLIMYKRKSNPFIPFEQIYDDYFKAIIKRDVNGLMKVFASMQCIPRNHVENRSITKRQIINLIHKNQELLKDKYSVKKLYLYGSFAKNKTKINSDLDLLIIFDEEKINFERQKLNENLKRYLGDILKIHIDLIDFTHALNHLDITEMENIITII